MVPPFWGFPAANPMMQQIQRDLERMQQRGDALFRTLLDAQQPSAPPPADVVYTDGALRLLRYRPVVAQPAAVPLLIVPSMLSRAHTVDLAPDNSLAAYLIARGLDVFVLDWGAPGPAGRGLTLDQYIGGLLERAAQRTRAEAGSVQLSVLGIGLGGTLAAIWAALYGRGLRNLAQVAAPINFHDDGVLSQWLSSEQFNADLVVDTLSPMPAALMQASFKMLTPAAEIMQQIALAEKLDDDEAVRDLLAIQAWINNIPLFLGEAFRTWIKDCCQENYLVQGKLVVNRRRVDLTRIGCPLLTVIAAKDRCCPPQSAAVLHYLVSSADKQLLELPCSHTGLLVGPVATEQLWPRLAEWLLPRSEPYNGATPAPLPETSLA